MRATKDAFEAVLVTKKFPTMSEWGVSNVREEQILGKLVKMSSCGLWVPPKAFQTPQTQPDNFWTTLNSSFFYSTVPLLAFYFFPIGVARVLVNLNHVPVKHIGEKKVFVEAAQHVNNFAVR